MIYLLFGNFCLDMIRNESEDGLFNLEINLFVFLFVYGVSLFIELSLWHLLESLKFYM